MLSIATNELVQKGRVLYKDENGNKVTIFAETNGESFKVKIRPTIDVEIKTLEFKIPYEDKGVNFSISKKVAENSGTDIVDDKTRQLLAECVKLIERWINIETCLFQADAQNVKKLFGAIKNKNMDSMVAYVMDAVEELRKYEEAKDIVKMYDAVIVDTKK